MPTLYRIVDVFEYLESEEEYTGLTLEEAAIRMDDLTGVGEDVILSDWDERCERCEGSGGVDGFDREGIEHSGTCPDCDGTGKWPGPWEWSDDETNRTVTMMREVEA